MEIICCCGAFSLVVKEATLLNSMFGSCISTSVWGFPLTKLYCSLNLLLTTILGPRALTS